MYFYKKESGGDIPCYQTESEITEEQENIFGDDKTFDKFITNKDNFHITEFTLKSDNHYSVEDCEKEAKKNYSNFFLVNDLSYTSNKNFKYTCTIPKNNIIYRPIQKETTDRSNIFTYLISPVNDFIANVFSNSNSQTTQHTNEEDLKKYLQNNKSNDKKCVVYNPSDTVTNENLNAFGGKDRYIIYKTKFINNDTYKNLQIKRKLTEYNEFNNNIDKPMAQINLDFQNFLTIVHDSSKKIQNYHNGTLYTQSEIDKQAKIDIVITDIKTATTDMWNKIFDSDNNKDSLVAYYKNIQDDTELLNSANKNYLNFIDALEDEIKKEKKIFNKLKLSKNGNNAKLHDTNFLKQIKKIEIIFLIILPIIVLFLVIKKK